jgi:hypothetical protein
MLPQRKRFGKGKSGSSGSFFGFGCPPLFENVALMDVRLFSELKSSEGEGIMNCTGTGYIVPNLLKAEQSGNAKAIQDAYEELFTFCYQNGLDLNAVLVETEDKLKREAAGIERISRRGGFFAFVLRRWPVVRIKLRLPHFHARFCRLASQCALGRGPRAGCGRRSTSAGLGDSGSVCTLAGSGAMEFPATSESGHSPESDGPGLDGNPGLWLKWRPLLRLLFSEECCRDGRFRLIVAPEG